MTLNMKMLRAVVAGLAGIAAATSVVTAGGRPGAASCQRTVAIEPQVTVSEGGRALTFVVHTGGCAAAGYVSYAVTDGTAIRPSQGQAGDFQLGDGTLQWAAGDMSPRRITAMVLDDALDEAALETFRVTLVGSSAGVRIAFRYGVGRVFDNDGPERLATVDGRVCLVYREACADGGSGPVTVFTFEPGLIINVPIVMNAAAPTDQTADVATSDGTLFAANLDYEPVDTTVHIPAGQTVVFVPVKLLPHAIPQNGKYFNVTVTSYTGGGVLANQGQITVWH